MLGNMEVERVFATFGALSRENILEIVPSGAMFDHMEAMLVRKCYRSWTLSFLIPDQPRTRTFKSLSRGDMLEIVTLQAFPVPFEPSLGHVYDVEVPISRKHA